MIKPPTPFSSAAASPRPVRHRNRAARAGRSCLPGAPFAAATSLALMAALVLLSPSAAQEISATGADQPIGQHWNQATWTGGQWSDGLAPSSGKTYTTGAVGIRTVDGSSSTFGGDSLRVAPDGRLMLKQSYGNTATIQLLILDGGTLVSSTGTSTLSSQQNISGNLDVASDSFVDLTGTNRRRIQLLNGNFTGAGNLTITGKNSDDLLQLAGTLIGSHTGDWTINGGRVVVTRDDQIGDSARVTMGSASAAFFEIRSAQTIGSLAGTGQVRANAAHTLTTGGDDTDTTFSGTLTSVGTISLVKEGTGTFTLSGNNAYTGDTTISNGTLRIGDGGTSGTLGDNSNTSVAAGAVLEINRTDATGYGYGGVLSGNGTVHVLSGGRRLDFTTNQTNSGNLSFEVNGTLGIRSASGATTVHLGELSGSGTIQRGLTSGTPATLVIGGKGTSSTFSGNITTAELSVEKVGSGSLTLSGNNDYGGTTTVSSGILVVDGNHTGSGGGYTVENGAAIGGNGSIDRTLALDSGANFWWDGSSTLTVEDDNLVSLDNAFGIGSLIGFDWADIALGDYILIANNSNFSNISNWGFDERVSVGGGKYAYFSEGSLQLNVVPEPSALGLLAIGLLTILGSRRRRC